MRQLASYARSIFWLAGIGEILIGGYMAVDIAVRRHSAHPRRPGAIAFAIGLCLLVAAIGAISCLAARAWRHKKPYAQPLVAIASIFHLLLFPFGTAAGAVGLWWCFSKKMQEAEPQIEIHDHQPKPEDGTHRWVQKAVPIVSIGIWIGSIGLANWWARGHGLPRGAKSGLILYFACEWIAVFCHELGHALAGWAVEMSLASFRVGPFSAQKQGGRWKLQFSFPGLLDAGGAVSTCPLHLKDLRRRMAFEIAGGPVASFLTALLAFAILLAAPGSSWEIWWRVPAIVAAISAGAGIVNLIPFGVAAGYSDGALLLQLFRGGRFADLREALKMVASTMVTSARPRDLDARVMSQGLRAGIGMPEEGTLQMIQLICAVDREDYPVAREHLESSLRRIPTPEQAPTLGCAAEMAFYMAYLDGDASRAGEWMRSTEKCAAERKTSLAVQSDYWRALTAVRKAEGLREEAEEAYQRAMQFLAKKPATGLYAFERELLQTVHTCEWSRPLKPALSQASV